MGEPLEWFTAGKRLGFLHRGGVTLRQEATGKDGRAETDMHPLIRRHTLRKSDLYRGITLELHCPGRHK